jgi:hypothetical protein
VLILPPLAAFTFAGITQDLFLENIANFAGIVTLVPIISEAIKDKYDLSGNTIFWNIKVMKPITWSLSILLVFVSWFTGWGFANFEIHEVAAYGIGAGLVANEYFGLATVKLLLEMLIKK